MEQDKRNKSDSDSQSDKSEPQSLPQQWPQHACSYCGIHNKNSVLKCSSKSCGKWFCNGKGQGGFASHIIFHLVKSKHNQIATHPQGQFGDLAIQCYVCGNPNVFVLGYVQVNQGNQSSVIFVCRVPCVSDQKANDLNWDPQSWNPIIPQKQLVNWIAQRPTENVKRLQLTVQDMIKLEQAWKINPMLKYQDIIRKRVTKNLNPVLLKYKTGKQYKSTFDSLLSQQAKVDKSIKQSQTQNNMKINFIDSDHRLYAYFIFNSREDYDASLLPGNQLRISYKSEWFAKGVVIKVTNNQQICLELFSYLPPPKADYPYKVQFIWKPTSYQRMKKGLKKFYNDHSSISSFLYHSILGQMWEKTILKIKIPQNFNTPGLPKLNHYQIEAVRRALVQPLCLIQGPPGTGKTVTSANIVYHLVKGLNQNSKEKKKQILVCAPSNVVVDMLAHKISLTGVNVVRFCSKSRQSVSSQVQDLTLHNKLKNYKQKGFQKLGQLLQKSYNTQNGLSPQQQTKFKALRKKAESEILQKADVICATCIASADKRLNQFVFNHVLIDQATQAIEPQCILPMIKSAKQVILVGDHLQLGPVVISRITARAGLNKSLFERLVLIGHKPIRLQVQYRMHPDLTYFPSNTFYQGTLQNGITEKDRKIISEFPWPKQKPSFFLNLYGTQQLSASGTSYLNRTQAAAVQKIVFFMERAGIQGKQIGIITPYKGQRAYITSYLQKNGQILTKNPNYYKQIQIASVDGYQGREKDYIIVSCVRSNDGPGIGFLKDPRRLNVTITRAKYGMVVLGNAKVLYQDNLWNNLLNDFKKNDTLVQGNIPNFRPTLLSFPPPQKYNAERKIDYKQQGQQQQDYSNTGTQTNLSFLDEVPINSGYRHSILGYTDIPEVAAFSKDRLFDIFSNKKQIGFGQFNYQDEKNALKELGLE